MQNPLGKERATVGYNLRFLCYQNNAEDQSIAAKTPA
jgi:hypothetical protein